MIASSRLTPSTTKHNILALSRPENNHIKRSLPTMGGDQPTYKDKDHHSEIESSYIDFEGLKGAGSRKRLKSECSNVCGSKAGREKQRRDRMNERHHGRPPKTDKTAILSDAIRMIMQLRSEAERLNESNVDLQEKIKELKAEKNELRDEKQRLKVEKEKLEQQVKSMNIGQPGYLAQPTAMRGAFAAQEQAAGNKLMPFVGYPGVAMWQFMPSSVVDTSLDHFLRPPVA
ncbi:transcription factor ILR3-like protein [Tanacetum coccineum]